jgi:hypothetical protein
MMFDDMPEGVELKLATKITTSTLFICDVFRQESTELKLTSPRKAAIASSSPTEPKYEA